VATDRVFTAALAAVSLAGMWLVSWSNTVHYRSPDAGGVLLTLAIVAPLAWRRQRPDLVLMISATALLAYDAIGYRSGLAWLATLWAVYSYAVHRRRRNAYWPLAVWVAAILALPALPGRGYSVPSALIFLVITVFVWIRGDAVRSGLLEAKREREARARQAVADERARIARELHDVVSHTVSVMVVQAEAARNMIDRDVARASQSVDAIASTGREALVELRRLLQVLSADGEPAPTAPAPTAGDIEELVERVRSTGQRVELRVEGPPRELEAGLSQTAYRVVQEALTNAMRYAGGALTEVRVGYEPDRLTLEVVDHGSGSAKAPAAGSGNGLRGLRERVAIFGGELSTTRTEGGGFAVRASLPSPNE